MNRKTRLLLLVGAIGAAIGIVAAARHCLHSMAAQGAGSEAIDICDLRPADGRCCADQPEETGALVA